MLILSTSTLYKYGLNRVFEIAKELQYDGIQLVVNPDNYDTYDEKYLDSLIQKYDLPIVGIGTPIHVSSAKAIRQVLKLAEKLNIPNLITRPPFFTDFRLTSWFKRELPKLQTKTKVNIAVVNVPAGTTFILPKFALGNVAELKRFDHICIDTSHLVSRKIDLMRMYQLYKNKLSFIHLSNWHKGNEHWMPNEGILPLESFLNKLSKDGYQGPISIKLNLDNIGGDDLTEVKKKLKVCQEFYAQFFTKVNKKK